MGAVTDLFHPDDRRLPRVADSHDAKYFRQRKCIGITPPPPPAPAASGAAPTRRGTRLLALAKVRGATSGRAFNVPC